MLAWIATDGQTYSRVGGLLSSALTLLSDQPRDSGANEDKKAVIFHYIKAELSVSESERGGNSSYQAAVRST